MITKLKLSIILINSITSVVILVIIYLSLTSRPVSPAGINNIDKIQHCAAYAVLAFFSCLSLKSWGVLKGLFLLVILFCSLLGGGLEVLQSYSGRMMELNDFIADVVGSLLGVLIVRIFSGV